MTNHYNGGSPTKQASTTRRSHSMTYIRPRSFEGRDVSHQIGMKEYYVRASLFKEKDSL
ncbi:hypothetical protein KIN20_015186 [Parelaphostrongylus tenuis]|uniref:Uncharacterized protein n=1 Tax=Parelaphostrongylus tenuis TaxID=148309 RepID=A0AAD5QPS6_PARTN|nr:hypothetical protein KIN20_015186 [Parelaphostrongylus tenuis]